MLERCPQSGLMRDFDAECKAYEHRAEQIRLASIGARNNQIARVCTRFELESDEFFSARDKALDIIRRNPNA